MAKSKSSSTSKAPAQEVLRKIGADFGKSRQSAALRKLAGDLGSLRQSAALRKLAADVEKWKQFAESQKSFWQGAEERAEKLGKARELIDRHNAIRDNLIPPPWMSKPKAEGRQVARIKKVLPEVFPPDGRPPDSMPDKSILDRINTAFADRGWKPAKRDSMARALGRRA